MAAERNGNEIIVDGELNNVHLILSLIFQAIEKRGYDDIVLDFRCCSKAYSPAMMSVCAQVSAYREAGCSFTLKLPSEKLLANLFQKTNWAYLLDPRSFSKSEFRGHAQIPATAYKSAQEQKQAVDRIVSVILGAVPELERQEFAAFEWAINELTDNVLVHSESPIGGLVQVSTFTKNRKQVEFVVADAGIGIPNSLRSGHRAITSDTEALDQAIREGVTRDTSIGQGNGLFGSYQICSLSGGRFLLDSGYARLQYNSGHLSINAQTIPFSGTLVAATIDFSDPRLLEEALSFGGVKHTPVDFIDSRYTQNVQGDVVINLAEEVVSFGSRVSGKPVQVKLLNLARMAQVGVIDVDFSGVPLLSSSFADEAFAKTFLALGPVGFMNKIRLINMSGAVEALVNRAMFQRIQVGRSDVS
jgi:hypothetical protein